MGGTETVLRKAGRSIRKIARIVTRSTNIVYLLIQLILVGVGTVFLRGESEAAKGVGAGILSAGVAGLVAFFYVALQEGQAQRRRAIDAAGVQNVFAFRGVSIKPEYDRRLRDARKNIDIIGFGLSNLRQDYADQFAVWAQRCPVRILLLDPQAPQGAAQTYSNARDREEGDPEGTIDEAVRRFLESTAHLRAVNPAFQIRLYSALPSINMFRVDDALLFGPYFLKQPSRNTPTMLLGPGLLFDRVTEHFESLWSDAFSKPVV